MSKGRARKQNVARTPSGQLSRALKNVEGLHHPSAIKRISIAAVRGMADSQWGTVIGRLYLEEKLTGVQFEAGKRWDELSRRYHRAMEAPSPDPQTAPIELQSKSAEVDPMSAAGEKEAKRHEATRESFEGAHEHLCTLGKLTEKAVRSTCEYGQEPIGYDGLRRLKSGLESLGQFWQIAKA